MFQMRLKELPYLVSNARRYGLPICQTRPIYGKIA